MMMPRLFVRLLSVTLFATCGAAGAWAQLIANPLAGRSEQTVATSASAPAEPPLADKRAENSELLRLAQRKLDEAGSADSAAAQELALYKSIEAVLAQQEAVDQQIKNLIAREQDLESPLQSAATVAPDTSVSFIELDRLRDELSSEQGRAKSIAAKLTAAKATLEKAQIALDGCEKARRQAQEAFETGRDRENAAELAATVEQTRQASRLAAETVALRKQEVKREELVQHVQKLSLQSLQQKADRVGPQVTFSKADLDEQLAQIKKQEETLKTALDKALNKLPNVRQQLSDARRQLDAASGDKAIAAERLEAWQRAHDKLEVETQLLNQQLLRLADVAVAWKRRYQLATQPKDSPAPTTSEGKPTDDPKSWLAATKATLDELAAETRSQIGRMAELRSDLATIAKKADGAKEGPAELSEWMEKQRHHLEQWLRLHEANLVAIESNRRVHERLLGDIGRGLDALSPKQLALTARDQASQIWKHELATINDKPITVEKVVKGLLILIAGWILSRVLSTLTAHRFLKQFRLSKDATAAIRTLLFYTMLAIVVLIALNAVNIPLTAFTILGGALAIGVGFGSQALINNFISGLIMLAERPVRIGERVVFGNYDGTVEEVGFRSTKLRTLTDHLVTIPNSNLVNEPIENIGRRRTIRRLLNITITYDTPREKITQAVEAVRAILEEPGVREPIHPIIGWDKFPPRVYFNDYNAESLNILVVYWYAPPEFFDYLDHCQNVNLRIYEEFERLGVDFAFPSRTLYLAGDAKRELAVRLSSEGGRMHDAA